MTWRPAASLMLRRQPTNRRSGRNADRHPSLKRQLRLCVLGPQTSSYLRSATANQSEPTARRGLTARRRPHAAYTPRNSPHRSQCGECIVQILVQTIVDSHPTAIDPATDSDSSHQGGVCRASYPSQFVKVVMLCAGNAYVKPPLDTATAPSCTRFPLAEVR
jgi:hypothetical protein